MATDFGKLNFAVSFNRTSAYPLEANSYFESLTDAETAAATAVAAGSSDSAYYIGQLVTVYTPAAGETAASVALYQIQADGTLSKFGVATSADELKELIEAVSARTTTLETAINDAESGLAATNTLAKQGVSDAAAAQSAAEAAQSTADTNAGNISALQTTVGDSTSGLVKDVADLKTTVGDSSSGLVKDVADLESNLGTLSTNVGTLSTNLESVTGRVSTLETTVGGLTGALVYRGVSTTDPASSTGPTVEGYTDWKSGDVVVYSSKEYVYDGTSWRELGDEGSHLTKTEAAATYVSKNNSVNGKAFNVDGTLSDITLYAEDITVSSTGSTIAQSLSTLSDSISSLSASTASAIASAIEALDVDAVNIGAGSTISAISQTDGKISVTTQSINIGVSQVAELSSLSTVSTTGLVKYDSTNKVYTIDESDYQTAASVSSTVSSAISSTIGSLSASFAGSTASTIVSLTQENGVISASFGAISIGMSQVSGLTTSLAGKVDVVDGSSLVSDALITKLGNLAEVYTIGEGLSLSGNQLAVSTISANQVMVDASTTLSTKLSEIDSSLSEAGKIDAITVNGEALTISNKTVDIPLATASRAGIVLSTSAENGITVSANGEMYVNSINVNKLVQTDGDTLTIDGGTASI